MGFTIRTLYCVRRMPFRTNDNAVTTQYLLPSLGTFINHQISSRSSHQSTRHITQWHDTHTDIVISNENWEFQHAIFLLLGMCVGWVS
jgi:hypothetical protein